MPPEGKAPAAVWRLQLFMAGEMAENSGYVFPLEIPFWERVLFPRKTMKDSPWTEIVYSRRKKQV